MSVGGKVAQVRRVTNGVAVRVCDPQHLNMRAGDWSCVHLHPVCPDIAPGDSLWWHGRHAYWTPRDRGYEHEDVKIPRLGYSHSDDSCGVWTGDET